MTYMLSASSIPPRLSDVAWLARITGLNHERLRLGTYAPPRSEVATVRYGDGRRGPDRRDSERVEVTHPHRRSYDPYVEVPQPKRVASVSPVKAMSVPYFVPPILLAGPRVPATYRGCLADQGLVCGPVFSGGPLHLGHAHSYQPIEWPARYGNARQGTYVLAGDEYWWAS